MNDRVQERINKVIIRFRESLSDEARQHVSKAQLDDLDFMIRELVSEELKLAVQFMEEALSKLRAESLDYKADMSL